MSYAFSNSQQIERDLCAQLANIRLSRNITQRQLAEEAGISLRTVRRLENGEGASLDSFLRVLIALRLPHVLEHVLPDPSIRPMERLEGRKKLRQRARPKTSSDKSGMFGPSTNPDTNPDQETTPPPDRSSEDAAWRWGDEA
jgi:transcriptional regulator with XRE-family HTH domain